MIDWYTSYKESFPDWYTVMTIFFMLPCGYKIAWGISDLPRFGSSYYGWSALKGLVGFVLCVFFLWPIPLVLSIVHMARCWNMSEIEEVWAYEEKRRMKRE